MVLLTWIDWIRKMAIFTSFQGIKYLIKVRFGVELLCLLYMEIKLCTNIFFSICRIVLAEGVWCHFKELNCQKAVTNSSFCHTWFLWIIFIVTWLTIYLLEGRTGNIWFEARTYGRSEVHASWMRAKYFPVWPDFSLNSHFWRLFLVLHWELVQIYFI